MLANSCPPARPEKVLHKSPCPVLTVPPRARATSRLPFKRVLCPVDFSPASLAALGFALSLAQEGDAALTILHVFEWPAEDMAPYTGKFNIAAYRREVEQETAAQLARLLPEPVRDWCTPRTCVTHGKPYVEILKATEEEGVDVIVMGVHGRNMLDRMLFGSTTNQIIRRATCPVLTLRG